VALPLPHRRPKDFDELARALERISSDLGKALLVQPDGTVELRVAGAGMILTSPDGNTRALVSINNAGAVISTTL